MFIQVDANTNKVILISAKKTKDATIEVTSIPTPTDEQHLEYINGKVVAVDNVSKSDLRREAYRAEVDELSTTYVGYKADAVKALKDGNAALAEQYEAIADSILEQIGEKKAEIRARYPDEQEVEE